MSNERAAGGLRRRSFLLGLGGSAAAGGAAAAVPFAGTAAADAGDGGEAPLGPVTVRPGDSRYTVLTTRGTNRRFTGHPESVRIVGTPAQVERAVDEAARDAERIAVRSGGHCFENFVDDTDVRCLIDISEMKSVYFDRRHNAFAVEAGATLGQMYRTLYLGWGVTVPGGDCPSVGVGGHFAGGGYGTLSRRHGLVADHVYGVEVVVVDGRGRARRVVATREDGDPNQDLWWAHTGGGGGNLGIVTRYLLRSRDARGDDPSSLLPRPPSSYLRGSITWPWKDMPEASLARLVHNFRHWHASGPGDVVLRSGLALGHVATGQVSVSTTLDGARADAARTLDAFLATMVKGIGGGQISRSTTPWLTAALETPQWSAPSMFKSKAAFQRDVWSDAQVAAAYQYLHADPDTFKGVASVYLTSFGGRTNSVRPAQTAMAHRDAEFIAQYETIWGDDAQTEAQLAWARGIYRDVYSGTGGVPVPGRSTAAGAYINYPDVDLADPRWNTSRVPWHWLYYRDNYARLQRTKARFDPHEVFRHDLSIRPPG